MIYEAIKHLKFRFGQDRITINEKDISALNHIIRSYNHLKEQTLNENRLFQKFFLNEFLSQAIRNGKTADDSITEIERLMKIPVDEFWWTLENETPHLKLANKMRKIGYVDLYQRDENTDQDGPIKVRGEAEEETNKKLVKENYQALSDCICAPVGFDKLKDHLEAKMTKIIALYKNQ